MFLLRMMLWPCSMRLRKLSVASMFSSTMLGSWRWDVLPMWMMRLSHDRWISIFGAPSIRCAKRRNGCGTADVSSTSPQAEIRDIRSVCRHEGRSRNPDAILAKELRGRNTTVNAVAPGPTGTELFLEGKSPELIEKLSKMNPLERLGTPEDIAAAVAFLVGPDGAWINGQTLRANGGMV